MRCLIIGCGCRGRLLARALRSQGSAVRGTTRDPASVAEIEAAGAEPVLADPDRVATLIEALDHVTVVCILLGSATGSDEQLRALHGSRLEMLLTKLIDTTAKGVVYEAAGSDPPELLAGGTRRVRAFGQRARGRAVSLEADPDRYDEWLARAVDAVNEAVGPS